MRAFVKRESNTEQKQSSIKIKRKNRKRVTFTSELQNTRVLKFFRLLLCVMRNIPNKLFSELEQSLPFLFDVCYYLKQVVRKGFEIVSAISKTTQISLAFFSCEVLCF